MTAPIQITSTRLVLQSNVASQTFTVTPQSTSFQITPPVTQITVTAGGPKGEQGIPGPAGPASFALVTDSEPLPRATGDIWFDDNLEVMNVHNGSNWQRVGQDDGFF